MGAGHSRQAVLSGSSGAVKLQSKGDRVTSVISAGPRNAPALALEPLFKPSEKKKPIPSLDCLQGLAATMRGRLISLPAEWGAEDD